MNTAMTTEVFDPVKMERLRHFLESNAEREKPRFYEIFVDNLKVVDKTNDPTYFDDYAMYVTEDTRIVRVLIYSCTETSPRHTKIIYTVKDAQKEKELLQKQELSGLEVQGKIEAAISAERERMELKQLREQLAEKEKKLEEAEEYQEELEARITELESGKSGNRELRYGQIASVAIEETLKRNPGWAKKVPLLNVLSGFLHEEGQENKELAGSSEQEPATGQASFCKKTDTETTTGLNEADTNRLHFMKSIESFFTEQQYEKVIAIIQGLAATPEQVDTVHDLLFQK